MTKSQAQKVLDAGGVTVGHVRALVAKYAEAPPEISRINPSLTGEQVARIFGNVFEGNPDDYEPDVWVVDKFSRARRPPMVMTREAIILRNVLIECAPRGWTPKAEGGPA